MKKLSLNGEVRDLLRQFNLSPQIANKAASVKKLSEGLGVDVHRTDLPRGMAGRLVQDPFSESSYAIEVNKSHDVRSQRFTVLHELGHFLLHADRTDFLAEPMHLNRSSDEFYFDTTQEQEANDFADTLLFGDGALAAAHSLYRGDVPSLAHYFGVTEPMVKVALRKFGVV
ncbi:ImmA/IrrE family metallo-endopeptidase [uncultured Tateyamaria sp.]|uniref:ImmA/IrrE family metallo-endopeptidase n=1 Tax=uncultured Tateyamaria sp. TaxID=455651 RepID=UPI0026280BB4|nr:ImmA/IrrE family metallo-endopeptidase [uncultured Tateyamaria sp.]